MEDAREGRWTGRGDGGWVTRRRRRDEMTNGDARRYRVNRARRDDRPVQRACISWESDVRLTWMVTAPV